MPAGDDQSFAFSCLEAHNIYRNMHGCPPLKFSQDLSENATLWAQHLLKIKKMVHSDQKIYGENIYMSDGRHVTGDMPVKAWYDEIEDYNFEEAKFSPDTGHFTQVIWKDSKELGVGIARKGHLTYVVANYRPPGNFRKNFKENVPPKKHGAPVPKKTDELPMASAAVKTNSHAPRDLIPTVYKDITAPDRIFHYECLKAHNKLRTKHGVPPLVLTEELTQYATKWAQTIADSKQLKHSGNKNFGENIYRAEGVHINGATPVKVWYEAEENYDYDVAKYTPDSAAFTQIVWKNTKELGVGVVRNSRDHMIIVVASYYPPGNVSGTFRENVLPKEVTPPPPPPPLPPPPKVFEKELMPPMLQTEMVPPAVKKKVDNRDKSTQATVQYQHESKMSQTEDASCRCEQKRKCGCLFNFCS